MDKPPYRVPSMAEITGVPWNGYTAASTFSGCGGSSLGYRMAGFRVRWASEFVPAARETYLANCAPGTVVDPRDIRKVSAGDVLAALGMEPGQLDLLDGSPPCSSFSSAGKRAAGWGKSKAYSDTTQRTDDLFFEFVRILRGVQPRAFVAENVSGLVKGVAKGYFREILAELRGCGYQISARLLDAQWLGVPQARQRLIFVGVRNDLSVEPAHPAPLPYRYSLREAIPGLTSMESTAHGWFDGGQADVDRPAPTVVVSPNGGAYNGHVATFGQIVAVGANAGFGTEEWQSPNQPVKTIGASPHTGNGRCGAGDLLVVHGEGGRMLDPETGERVDLGDYAVGREGDRLKPGEQSAKYFSEVRLHPDRPSNTVTARGGSVDTAGVTHPTQRRKFTLGELRRVCGFPDDFVLTGTYSQRWERLGRAVPPVMMYHVAAAVRDRILAVVDGNTP